MFTLALQILAQETQTPAESSDYPWGMLLLFAAILLLGMFLMKRTQRRVARSQSSASMPVSERVSKVMPGHDIYSQIGELMAQLADLSRQINGQIDTRIAKLEALLDQADQTLARLENAPGIPKNAPESTSSPSSNSSHPSSSPSSIPAPAESLRDIAEKFHQQPKIESSPTPPPNSPTAPSTSPTADSSAPSAASQSSAGDSLKNAANQEIQQMHRSGMSVVAIAQKSNRPIGEIELILALDNKKNPPEAKNL